MLFVLEVWWIFDSFCVPCSLFSMKSLLIKCTIFTIFIIWSYILFNSLFRRFGCSVSSTFSHLWRIDLLKFVLLSCSVITSFAWCLKVWPSMQQWFDAGMLSLMGTFFLWLLSLMLNWVSDLPTYFILNVWCSCFCNLIDEMYDKF